VSAGFAGSHVPADRRQVRASQLSVSASLVEQVALDEHWRKARVDHALRQGLSLASPVHRPSWQVSPAAAVHLPRLDNPPLSDDPLPQRAS
jgi:hypothetical protein